MKKTKELNIKKKKKNILEKTIKNQNEYEYELKEIEKLSYDNDFYNEDASRSYHKPNETITYLTSDNNNIKLRRGHAIIQSIEIESDDAYDDNNNKNNFNKLKYSSNDISPIDVIDPIQ
eukprot:188298_1